MVSRIGHGATVLKEQTLETTVIRFAHRGVNTHIRRHTSQHQVCYPALAQHQLKVGRAKGALTWLVDYWLSAFRP